MADVASVAIAIASAKADVKSLHLAQPLIRTTSKVEVTAAGALLLSALGLWLLVIPIELIGLVAT